MQQSNLNLIPSGDMPVIYASQYDNNRVIRFNLFDGEDEYTLSGTETVKCNIRKNDEHIVVIVPTIGANKYIDVALTEQACACFGDNIGEITISSGEDNIIGTINFILKVERNPIQGGVTSASDIADLETQIEEIVHEVMTDDYYTRDEVDAKLDLKANASSVYTKSEVDTALASKANASDVYTKSQVDTALGLKADKADTYTKSEVDTALAAKANASDVYTKTEVDEMIDDLYPVNTASGSIANFTTSLAKPLTALSSTIVAQQAGTGTPSPSNPRSISGVSSVVFQQTGKNLVNYIDKTISSANYVLNNENCSLPAGNYVFSFDFSGTGNSSSLRLDDEDGNQIFTTTNNISSGRNSISFTLTERCSKIKYYSNAVGTYSNFQIEVGSSDTDYEAYKTPNTFTIALGQTVYGGSVDCIGGTVKKTWGYISDISQLEWVRESANGTFRATVPNIVNPDTAVDRLKGLLCSSYVLSTNASISNLDDLSMARASGYLLIRDSNYSDATTFANSLSEVTLAYELATPVEITGLIPANFTTFAGEQNIFADCGEVTVGFKQGIQEYIDAKTGG